MTKKFTIFFGSESPFSQWHRSPFSNSGRTYNCAEQYMMHHKALIFGDDETAKKIMKAKHPRDQKTLGRTVRGFDENRWKMMRWCVVSDGNRAKFSQNDDLRKKLFATRGTTLVEASPTDRIWGIGLPADHPFVRRPELWLGLNLLGKILTELRDCHLMREYGVK